MIETQSDQFKARLKQALAARNFTITDLAHAVGVSPQAVSKWIKRGRMSQQHMPKVADALETSLDWLLRGCGLPPSVQERERYVQASPETRKLIDTILQLVGQGVLSEPWLAALRRLLKEMPGSPREKRNRSGNGDDPC